MNEPTIADVQNAVCVRFAIVPSLLTASVRTRHVRCPRHVAMWLAARVTPSPMKAIARAFNCDRSTVFHALNKVDRYISQKDEYGVAALELHGRFLHQWQEAA